MQKWLKRIVLSILLLFLVIQLYRPERSNPAVDESQTLFSTLPVPEEVQFVLRRSCFDCHSNETEWPWYSNVAPASWLVAGDVEEGRSRMNLSEFGKYRPLRALSKLDMMCEEISDGRMPLPPYLILHPDARLSQEEIDLICNWVDSVRDTLLNME